MTKLDKLKNVEKVISRSYFIDRVLYFFNTILQIWQLLSFYTPCHYLVPNLTNPHNLTIYLANSQTLVNTKILGETKTLVYSLENW